MRFIIYGCIVLLCFSCNNKKGTGDCSQVKNGEFYLSSSLADTRYRIVRTDSIQQETDLSTGYVFTLRVEWINDCEYDLHFISVDPVIKPTTEEEKKLWYEYISSPSRVRIINVEKNYYEVNVKRKGMGEWSDTIWYANAYRGIGGFRPIGH